MLPGCPNNTKIHSPRPVDEGVPPLPAPNVGSQPLQIPGPSAPPTAVVLSKKLYDGQKPRVQNPPTRYSSGGRDNTRL
jgi:hypothetical protein